MMPEHFQDDDGPGADETPAISVLMPARNAARFLDEAIASILGQTFSDFELIICDDASSDRTAERIANWAERDSRIRAYYSQENLGPSEAANWTVSLARAPLLVRMDADDISRPDRLEKQFEVMRDNPDIVLFGSMFDGIDKESRKIYGFDRSPLFSSTFSIPCGHAMSIMRASAVRQAGGYRKECDYWEDADLFFRMAKIGKVCFGAHPLYRYRHSRAHSRVNTDIERVERALDLKHRCGQTFLSQGEYESVLASERHDPSSRISPNIFFDIATLYALAGNRHHLLRRFLKRARVSPVGESSGAFAKLLLMRVAPKLVRWFQARRRSLRDKSAIAQLGNQTIVEWHWSKHHPAKREKKP